MPLECRILTRSCDQNPFFFKFVNFPYFIWIYLNILLKFLLTSRQATCSFPPRNIFCKICCTSRSRFCLLLHVSLCFLFILRVILMIGIWLMEESIAKLPSQFSRRAYLFSFGRGKFKYKLFLMYTYI